MRSATPKDSGGCRSSVRTEQMHPLVVLMISSLPQKMMAYKEQIVQTPVPVDSNVDALQLFDRFWPPCTVVLAAAMLPKTDYDWKVQRDCFDANDFSFSSLDVQK